MRLASLSNRLGGSKGQPDAGSARGSPGRVAEPPPALAGECRPGGLWAPARLALLDELCGDGFLLPGGAEEILHQIHPLGLAAGAALLLVGVGVRGPARAIAARLGATVAAYEAELALAAIADQRGGADPDGRATVEEWHPRAPSLRQNRFEHALALMPLAVGAAEPLLMTAFEHLQTTGRLLMIDLVAAEPASPSDPAVAGWLKLERPSSDLLTETAVTRMLGGLGFDVRNTDNLTERYTRQALAAWRRMAEAMRSRRPDRDRAAMVFEEGERWRLRLQLMRKGRLRLVRWHATLWGGA